MVLRLYHPVTPATPVHWSCPRCETETMQPYGAGRVPCWCCGRWMRRRSLAPRLRSDEKALAPTAFSPPNMR